MATNLDISDSDTMTGTNGSNDNGGGESYCGDRGNSKGTVKSDGPRDAQEVSQDKECWHKAGTSVLLKKRQYVTCKGDIIL